jgi:glutamate formiminotransferase
MNIVDADAVSVADAYDTVAVVAQNHGATIRGAELVGLLPERQLLMNDESRWRQLDIGREKTIEARLARRA